MAQPEGPRLVRTLGSICLIIAAAASFITTAQARKWVVDKTGAGDFTVIQDASDATSPGDTILIFPGRYLEYEPYDFGALTESTFVVIEKPDITIMGVHRDSVIIGPKEFRWVRGANEPNGISGTPTAAGLRVENLTVENVNEGVVFFEPAEIRDSLIRGCYAGTVSWSPGAVLYENCEYEGCTEFGLVSWTFATGSVVDGCTFHDINSRLLVSQIQDVLIQNCSFLGNTWVQFQTFSSGSVLNCTFDGGSIIIMTSQATIEGNVLQDSWANALDVSESNVTARRNILRGGVQATILLRAESDVFMEDNHIFHTQGPSVDVRLYNEPGHVLDLRNNWWGTTDEVLIEQWIVDKNDIPSRGEEVLWQPILAGPVPVKKGSVGSLKAAFGGRNGPRPD